MEGTRQVSDNLPGKPVVRRQERVPRCAETCDPPLRPDARIDDGDMDGAASEPAIRQAQPQAADLRPVRRNVVADVDDIDTRRLPGDYAFHDPDERILEAEVRGQRNSPARIGDCRFVRHTVGILGCPMA